MIDTLFGMEYFYGYFILKNLVCNPAVKPEELKNLDHFIDDNSGQGMWRGAGDQFRLWVESVRYQIITNYGLDITYEVQPITEFIQLLDIQYKFHGGRLQQICSGSQLMPTDTLGSRVTLLDIP